MKRLPDGVAKEEYVLVRSEGRTEPKTATSRAGKDDKLWKSNVPLFGGVLEELSTKLTKSVATLISEMDVR